MGNLFRRIKHAIEADLNDVLDEKEKQNPIAMLNHYLRQCEQETEKVRVLIERQYSLKEQFAKEYQTALELAEKRRYQAEIAAKAGENELHEFVAAEHQQYAERAARVNQALEQTKEQLEVLERKYQDMKHKLKDMTLRRMELMGRENVSRANQRMNHVLETDVYSNKAVSHFQEIENYLERLEQQVNRSYMRSTIDERIAQLEKEMNFADSKPIS